MYINLNVTTEYYMGIYILVLSNIPYTQTHAQYAYTHMYILYNRQRTWSIGMLGGKPAKSLLAALHK